MRARIACLCVLVAAGCTRENPAFDLAVDTEAETQPGTDTEPPETGGEEAPGPVCELKGGKDLDIQLAQICGADPYVYEQWLVVSGYTDANTWAVHGCTLPGCTNCESMVTLNLKFAPLQVEELAGPETCLHVFGRRREPGDVNSCDFQSAVVWEVDANGGHDLVLVARSATDVELPAPEGNSAPATPDFNPSLVYTDSCPCDEFDGACCADLPPTVYGFDVGGNTVPIAAVVPVDVGGRSMDFHALNAFQSGECMEDLPHVSWALTRPPSP